MEVPLDRVKQIELAGARAERPKFSRTPVRATFVRGGSVSFELEGYDGRGFAAQSPAFGKAVFDRSAFSRIEIDPKDKTATTPPKAN